MYFLSVKLQGHFNNRNSQINYTNKRHFIRQISHNVSSKCTVQDDILWINYAMTHANNGKLLFSFEQGIHKLLSSYWSADVLIHTGSPRNELNT